MKKGSVEKTSKKWVSLPCRIWDCPAWLSPRKRASLAEHGKKENAVASVSLNQWTWIYRSELPVISLVGDSFWKQQCQAVQTMGLFPSCYLAGNSKSGHMERFYFFLSKLSYRRQEGAFISNLMGCLERFSPGSDSSISVLITLTHLPGSYLLHLSFPRPLKLLCLCTRFSHISWEAKVLNVPISLKATEKETKIAFLSQMRGTLKNKLTAWGHMGGTHWWEGPAKPPKAESIPGSLHHLRCQSQPALGCCWRNQKCFSIIRCSHVCC